MRRVPEVPREDDATRDHRGGLESDPSCFQMAAPFYQTILILGVARIFALLRYL